MDVRLEHGLLVLFGARVERVAAEPEAGVVDEDVEATKGVEGGYRFLGRAWRLFVDEQSETDFEQRLAVEANPGPSLLDRIRLSPVISDAEPLPAQLKALHACIKKVTEDLEDLRFNTAISALMKFVNEAMTWETRPRSVLRDFLILLNPFAPHLAEELWAAMGHKQTLAYEPWPKFDPALVRADEVEVPVQINGKLRGKITVAAGLDQAALEQAARNDEKIKPLIEGKTLRKVIVVPGKLVNFVVG